MSEQSEWLEEAVGFACHDASCAPPPVGTGGSVPVGRYGMRYNKSNEKDPYLALGRAWSGWDGVPVTKHGVNGRGPVLEANEATVKKETVDRVASSGKVREGYVTRLVVTPSGAVHIADGHHRVAIHTQMDQDMDVQALDLRKTVQTAVKAVRADGGFTLSLDGQAPSEGIAVSPYPERTQRILADRLDVEVERAVGRFIEKNADLLAKPEHFLGGWHEGGHVWLDVSRVFPADQRDEAVALGREHNQISIWDIGAGEEIPTGGTGLVK
jgi:hypothetical protein